MAEVKVASTGPAVLVSRPVYRDAFSRITVTKVFIQTTSHMSQTHPKPSWGNTPPRGNITPRVVLTPLGFYRKPGGVILDPLLR